MKNDLEQSKAEEEENSKSEIQTHRFILNISDKEKKKNDIPVIKSEFEMETDRFKLGKDLKSLEKEKEKKNDDIVTRKSEDFNCLEKKSSSTMEESHSDKEEEEEEEERSQWKFEQEEYVCCVCGLKGSRLLGYYSCCNEQLAHRYCAALKETKDEAAADNGMSKNLSEFFQTLRETKASVIDHFIRKKHK